MGSSLNPAGIKKPSPGFIMKADASLAPLNNAQIEVRAMSGARAPSRFPPFSSRLFRAACQSGGSPARNDAFRAPRFGLFLKGKKRRFKPPRGGSRSVDRHAAFKLFFFSSVSRLFLFLAARERVATQPDTDDSP